MDRVEDYVAHIKRYDGAANVPYRDSGRGVDTIGSLPKFRQHSVLSGIEEGESVLSGSGSSGIA